MKKTVGIILIAINLASCSFFRPYEREIEQGSVLTPATVSSLHAGMSKQEVIHRLGTPLLHSPFHDDRLVYVYTDQIGNNTRTTKTLICHFKNGRLTENACGGIRVVR